MFVFHGIPFVEGTEVKVVGEVQMEGPQGPRVTGPEEMAGQFHAELMVALPRWKQRLGDSG